MGRFGRNYHSGFLAPLAYWNDYKHDVQDSHGGKKYDLEHVPFFSSWWRYRQGRERAEDYWQNTGIDDHYSDRYIDNSLNQALGSLSAPLPGVRLPTMARTLAKMYGAEVELNIARHRRATAQMYRDTADKWNDNYRLKYGKYRW